MYLFTLLTAKYFHYCSVFISKNLTVNHHGICYLKKVAILILG